MTGTGRPLGPSVRATRSRECALEVGATGAMRHGRQAAAGPGAFLPPGDRG